uniref:hypothetical protein n=1 Tax=Prevotella melaninogenica TaxID=28132 RepID=UPI002151A100|nr:hypothetical protein [Prevotella melaninogenica]
MKEQVTDISKVLQGITEDMRLLRETVNQQYAEIIKLNRNINALNLEIRKKDTELINLRSVLDYVTQVISIPELKPVIKEIRHYVMICKNCGERIRTVPRWRSNNVVYDSSVKTLVVYLNVVQFLPYGSHSKFFA